MKKTILIDVSLTGGRGPAKKVKSFTEYCDETNVDYQIITDRKFVAKLEELDIKPNFIVDTDMNEPESDILGKFYEVVKGIDYSIMIKFGARIAGPMASRKLNRPYVIIDGGLPDYMTDDESLYEAKTYQQAKKYMVTTQFEWNPPQRVDLDNVEVVCYPLSSKDFELIEKLRGMTKTEILKSYKPQLAGDLPDTDSEVLINLLMTSDYIALNKERKTYGGWLEARQYDQVVGFIRRLVTDLGEFFDKPAYLFMDKDVAEVPTDLLTRYKNVKVITFKDWDFETEIAMQAAADVVVSRATNYQPYVAALRKGNSVTTPVPADGYMDEDTAALQYEEKGLTKLIQYDAEDYVKNLKNFLTNNNTRDTIRTKLNENMNFIKNRNANKILIDMATSIRQEV